MPTTVRRRGVVQASKRIVNTHTQKNDRVEKVVWRTESGVSKIVSRDDVPRCDEPITSAPFRFSGLRRA